MLFDALKRKLDKPDARYFEMLLRLSKGREELKLVLEELGELPEQNGSMDILTLNDFIRKKKSEITSEAGKNYVKYKELIISYPVLSKWQKRIVLFQSVKRVRGNDTPSATMILLRDDLSRTENFELNLDLAGLLLFCFRRGDAESTEPRNFLKEVLLNPIQYIQDPYKRLKLTTLFARAYFGQQEIGGYSVGLYPGIAEKTDWLLDMLGAIKAAFMDPESNFDRDYAPIFSEICKQRLKEFQRQESRAEPDSLSQDRETRQSSLFTDKTHAEELQNLIASLERSGG